jgi:Tol biopolymer transport system component
MHANYASNILANRLWQGFSAVFILACVTPVLAQTPPLRANGKIAFTSDRDGNHEIYVMSADGTNHVRLTNNSVVDDHPTWSPDGTKIAFVSQRPSGEFAIFQMNADGTNKTEITPITFDTRFPIWDAWSMSWSPDGSRIAFHERPAHSQWAHDIFIVNIDGSDRRVLIDGPHDERQPAWSPDGSRILFSKQVSTFFHNLYTIKPDGTDLRALAGFDGETDLAPSWSPTGDKIAFQIFDYANFENIGIANADGSGRDWFDNGSLSPDYGGRDKPQWSPDGTKLIFHVSREEIGTEIYVKNTDGTGLAQLTNTPGNNFKPSWQPLPPTAPNPIEDPAFFVRMHYLDFLSREPEPAEPWTALLRGCREQFNQDPAAPSARCDRLTVSAAFFQSPEFRLKGFYAFTTYRAAFGRLPEYAEIIADMQGLAGATPAEVYQRRAHYAAAFTARAEFKALYDALPDAAFVAALLDHYNLQQITSPDPADPEGGAKVSLTRADLIARLGGQTLTRAQVLRAVVESDEVGAAEFNRAFVAMQYYGYLRRTPEPAGYEAWLRVIRENPSNVRLMVNGFVNSQEYRSRFGQP